MFPTPRSEDSQSCGAHKGQPDTLTAFTKLFPTPCAGDATGSRGSKGKHRPNEGGLAKAVKFWPTPKGSPSGPDFARMNREGSGGDDLATAVARETFPAPTVDDADNSTLPKSQTIRDNLPGHLLRSGEQPGGQLNPTWVEWLMGWPLGWTDLNPLAMDKFQQWCEQYGRF